MAEPNSGSLSSVGSDLEIVDEPKIVGLQQHAVEVGGSNSGGSGLFSATDTGSVIGQIGVSLGASANDIACCSNVLLKGIGDGNEGCGDSGDGCDPVGPIQPDSSIAASHTKGYKVDDAPSDDVDDDASSSPPSKKARVS